MGFVTLDNFSDTKILEEKAEVFLREEATKPKKEKKVGKMAKILQRLDEIEKRIPPDPTLIYQRLDEIEKRVAKLEN